jgi:antitoxin component YwqK of YwqJK toxin-antitoxin module
MSHKTHYNFNGTKIIVELYDKKFDKYLHNNNYENGTCYEWHSDGSFKKKISYLNGKPDGEMVEWLNKILWIKSNYVEGQLDGEYVEWYNDNQIAKKSFYIKSKLSGEHCEWYPNGQLYIMCNFVDGLVDGTYYEWYHTGEAFKEKYYTNGKIYGTSTVWNSDGTINTQTYFPYYETYEN